MKQIADLMAMSAAKANSTMKKELSAEGFDKNGDKNVKSEGMELVIDMGASRTSGTILGSTSGPRTSA